MSKSKPPLIPVLTKTLGAEGYGIEAQIEEKMGRDQKG